MDYKTGKGAKRATVDPWGEDRYQLPLYWRAAEEVLLPRVGAREVEEAALVQIHRGIRTRRLGEVDEGRLLRTLEVFADGVARGRFFLRPGRHCEWCDFRRICRREPLWRSAGKLESDAAAGDYREVKGM